MLTLYQGKIIYHLQRSLNEDLKTIMTSRRLTKVIQTRVGLITACGE
jgi:hypothetical protein